jgi:hypothetical protein
VTSLDQAALMGGRNYGQWIGEQWLITIPCLELAPTEPAALPCGEYQCVKRQVLSVLIGLASMVRLV